MDTHNSRDNSNLFIQTILLKHNVTSPTIVPSSLERIFVSTLLKFQRMENIEFRGVQTTIIQDTHECLMTLYWAQMKVNLLSEIFPLFPNEL
jgi:hypothetical protein